MAFAYNVDIFVIRPFDMCGVACVFGSGNINFASDVFNFPDMMGSLLPRGPDGNGEFEDETIKMFHSRLSVIDVTDASAQPFLGERWILSYNGEIYNFRVLKAKLESKGVVFRTTGDTEVLAKAIECWGVVRAAQEIAGMFAFLAYDRKNKELWVARDRLGIKPLFYTVGNNYIAFGSWPSTLLKGLNRKWVLDIEGMHRFFQLGAVYGSKSLVENITELPPGEVWCINSDLCFKKETYWTPISQSRAFDQEKFEELFSSVVAEHTYADVPSCLLLSGGVDSTALAAAMRQGQAFHLNSSETHYATKAARVCGLELECVDSENETSWEENLLGFSIATGSAFSSIKQTYTISKAIFSSGSKMALSANGADELYLGYSRTYARSLPEKTMKAMPLFESAPATNFEQQIRHIFTSGANLSSLFTEGKNSVERDEEFLSDCWNHYNSCVDRVGSGAASRLFELETYVRGDLNANLDHASMYWGVEIRVPFLDHRLVEHALSLEASDLIVENLGRKAPLKNYLLHEGISESIWNRKKLGFSINSRVRMNTRDELLACLVELSNDGIVQFLPRRGNFGRDFMRMINSAFAFRAWKRVWIDTGIVSL